MKEDDKELLVIDETNFFKFKLTQKDRRLIKKKFGEKGYQMFLWLNSMGYFSDMDTISCEIIHQMLNLVYHLNLEKN